MKPSERLLKRTQGNLKAEITQRLEEISNIINNDIDIWFSHLIKKIKDSK